MKNLKLQKKLIALALVGGLTLTTTGCPKMDEVAIVQEEDYDDSADEICEEHENEVFTSSFLDNQEAVIEEIHKNSLLDLIEVPAIEITEIANLRTHGDDDSDIIATLPVGKKLEVVDNQYGWYKVLYGTKYGYVSNDVAEDTTILSFPYTYTDLMYLDQDSFIYTNEELTESVELPRYEFVEVYDSSDDYYLVKTNEYQGYIKSDVLKPIEGNFAVVDLSDQDIKFYSSDELVYYSGVVTGKHNATNVGIFDIYNITTNRYLIGPNYKSYVDYMMKFDGNIGLHDAEYHTNLDGFSHGWRNLSEFGTTDPNVNGSHGCVNMPQEAAEFAFNHLSNGDKVLVKK